MARRYGLHLFDKQLVADLKHPYRRAVLAEALQLYDERDYYRSLLDTLFVALIKFLPHQAKEAANAANKLETIVGKRELDNEDKFIFLGGKMMKVVDEIDDSEIEIRLK